jgi:hypothetical protein
MLGGKLGNGHDPSPPTPLSPVPVYFFLRSPSFGDDHALAGHFHKIILAIHTEVKTIIQSSCTQGFTSL